MPEILSEDTPVFVCRTSGSWVKTPGRPQQAEAVAASAGENLVLVDLPSVWGLLLCCHCFCWGGTVWDSLHSE